MALKNHDPHGDLIVVSDSRYVIDGLTKNLRKWEDRGWTGITNGKIFRDIIAWARWRKGRTYLRWTKGHAGTRGNEEADRLAGEGAKLPIPPTNEDPTETPEETAQGMVLAKLEQRDFYRILRDRRKIPQRKTTAGNIRTIQEDIRTAFGVRPTEDKIWMTTKHKDLTRKTRDYIWKSVQGAYKIGGYWTHIEGFQDRGTCPLCDETEDMEHILLRCKAETRELAWTMANEVWKKKDQTTLPTTLGGILGCGLASFTKDGKPQRGKNRLYRILVSETAYLIWKLQNERRIRDDDGPIQTNDEVGKRWTHAINKRLLLDRLLTNTARFRKNAIESKLVKATWSECLTGEDDLPTDWPTAKGVLVGISVARPPGRAG